MNIEELEKRYNRLNISDEREAGDLAFEMVREIITYLKENNLSRESNPLRAGKDTQSDGI